MKRILSFVLCLFLVIASPLSASASMPKIIDDAGLLTDLQLADLEQRAADLVNRYEMDIVIVTVDSLGDKTSEEYADDYYDYNGYGVGEDFSGVLLLLSMEYRDWAISTCGEAIYAITDYSIQNLFSEIAEYLAQDQYYQAFCIYLDSLENLLGSYSSGNPVDGNIGNYEGPGSYIPGSQEDIVYYEPDREFNWYAKRIGISFLAGVIVALVALLIMRSQMNTAKNQHGATSYLAPGTYKVNIQKDIFLSSQISKVRKSENTSSGGGSSAHRSSSGRSHGGGHGKF